MEPNFKKLTKEEKLQVSGGAFGGAFVVGLTGGAAGIVVALVYNTVTGARGDEARENTKSFIKTGAVVGGCIGAYTPI